MLDGIGLTVEELVCRVRDSRCISDLSQSYVKLSCTRFCTNLILGVKYDLGSRNRETGDQFPSHAATP